MKEGVEKRILKGELEKQREGKKKKQGSSPSGEASEIKKALAPTAELIGPKNGKIIAKNHIGMTTGKRASALKQMLFVSCIPITFSHTKYNGVQANP